MSAVVSEARVHKCAWAACQTLLPEESRYCSSHRKIVASQRGLELALIYGRRPRTGDVNIFACASCNIVEVHPEPGPKAAPHCSVCGRECAHIGHPSVKALPPGTLFL